VTEELQRASDAERERAVARLREAPTEGRLTLEELADFGPIFVRHRRS
jgi:hypothetical protein